MNTAEWTEHWTSLYKTMKIINVYGEDRKTPTDSHFDRADTAYVLNCAADVPPQTRS